MVAAFVTYENRNNPHVAIHIGMCTQIRKRGGEHKHSSKGVYTEHASYEDAEMYAASTHLPIKRCSYCKPQPMTSG